MKLEFVFEDDSTCEFNDSREGTETNFDIEANDTEAEGNFGENGERVLKVRLDKWLWAARFFKTRALARAAVEAGKVFYDGERCKASREIELEAVLQVRLGRFEKTVIVKGLSTRRRSTEEALQLFEETESSKNSRAQQLHRQPTQFTPWQQEPMQPYSSAYPETNQSGSPYATEQRERRPTRFLRRSFMKQPTHANPRPERSSQYGKSPYRVRERDYEL